MLQINTYECLKFKRVKNTISLPAWIELIRQSDYTVQILAARQYDKGDKEYDDIKEAMPCVTYNFLFNRIKTNKTITSNTGIMMIDIDVPTFDFDSLDLTKILMAAKSFGGQGYTLLVQVEGLTLNNFSTTYLSICNDLGLIEFFDKGAKKPTQYSVLSYDPNVIYNPDSFIFDAIEPFINENSPLSIEEERKETYTIEWGEKDKGIKYTNKHDFQIEGNYQVNWINPYKVIECFIPIHKISDGRKMSLISYCTNLVYLNQWLPHGTALNIMRNVNKLVCLEPLEFKVLDGIVKSVIQQRNENRLQPIVTDRKIIFNKEAGLSREDKLEVCRNENAKKKTTDSKDKLNSIIESWDLVQHGKITQAKIYNNYSISSKTVEKYWPEFKSFVADLNSLLKPAPAIKKIKEKTIMINKQQPILTEEYIKELDTLTWYIGDQQYHFGNYTVIESTVKDDVDNYRLRNQSMSAPYNDADLLFNGRKYDFIKYKSGNETMILLSA
ncbi:hypothetical protein [Pedobacter cryoconitis]|uniref:Uncharacterized protein n=1 Tax=Pedobacter cryoconitis TaxID=188932 RepID=A0A327S2E5_9SPHI|nr:hypothetical protein [Pedobacter cryoconitis]RAJ22878.1 hypothetical protein LY11_04582 [Pedobacter cryoconitis]